MGSEEYKFSSFIKAEGVDDWYVIRYKGKSAGQVHLKMIWKPEVDESAKAQQPANVPAPTPTPEEAQAAAQAA